MDVKDLIALVASSGGKIEITFNTPTNQVVKTEPKIETKQFIIPGVDITKPIPPILKVQTDDNSPIPSTSLEEETGMSYNDVLNWSADSGAEPSVAGTNDIPISDTLIKDPSINGVNSVSE